MEKTTGQISTDRNRPWARRSLAGALTIVALSLVAIGAYQAVAAPEQIASSRPCPPVAVVAGRISGETYGLYLVDYENKTLSVYQVAPKAKEKLRLMAGRTYAYDVRLDEYNTTPPPSEIKQLVEQHRRLSETP